MRGLSSQVLQVCKDELRAWKLRVAPSHSAWVAMALRGCTVAAGAE
jgi:hypothetical protein